MLTLVFLLFLVFLWGLFVRSLWKLAGLITVEWIKRGVLAFGFVGFIHLTIFYYLFLDHRAGVGLNFKYMFYSEASLAEEDIFLPSTTYWRGEFSGKDSQDILRQISEKKFNNNDIDEFLLYLVKSRFDCLDYYMHGNPNYYPCDFEMSERPLFSPRWRLHIEFDDMGRFNIRYIAQHFELLP